MRVARRLPGLLVALLCAIAVAPPLLAQKRRPMTLIDLAELPRVIGPQLSPDGRTVAYFLSGADWKAGRLVFHLWRQDVSGGAPAQLTFTEGGDIPVARWSPDGAHIAFVHVPTGGIAEAQDSAQERIVYIVDVKTRRLTRLSR